MWKKSVYSVLLAGLILTGCDSVDTTPGSAQVAVTFQTPESVSKSAHKSGATLASSLTITEGNGTLELTDIRLIVAEFELEATDANCDVEGTDEEECPDFESGLYFIDLPLDGTDVNVATANVPLGSYAALNFEVEDVEVDEDDSVEEQQQIQSLLSQIRADAAYSDWPETASMAALGTFTPTGSTEALPFKVYFDAEIEVEIEFTTPLELTDDGIGPDISVRVIPESWFVTETGVFDLSRHNYDPAEGNLVEFELEIEKGFGSLEIEYELEGDD